MLLTMCVSAAYAEQDENNSTAAQKATPPQAATPNADTEPESGDNESLMDKPVDFSTTEKAEETLQNIRVQEGERAYEAIESAMKYLLFYDLSVSNNKEKLYKKLDGKTPKEIIAKTRR